MSLLHGSQGCATYIRRYMISHFREPLDIASSSFGEEAAIFGGRNNLRLAIDNVVRQYAPQLVGIATTCLAETIGDDVPMYLHEIAAEGRADLPSLVHVSTPSYSGSYEDGYHAAALALVKSLAQEGPPHDCVNVIAPIASPADLRFLKQAFREFGLEVILLPDYSDTLDGPAWSDYRRIPPGGTPLAAIRRMAGSRATVEFGFAGSNAPTAGRFLEERFGVPRLVTPPPIGVEATDRFLALLRDLRDIAMPNAFEEQRGRLVDAYVDAHKYVFGKKAVVYGERDLVTGIAAMLAEVGMTPVLCATGASAGHLQRQLATLPFADRIAVCEDVDFAEIERRTEQLHADLIVGSSKGYGLARKLGIPLVRVGFPVHDRVDGPRLLHLGYGGAQQLFDRLVNSLIEASQDASPIGYSYM
jgi:nitrogenase molybdenum-iron protein NifN